MKLVLKKTIALGIGALMLAAGALATIRACASPQGNASLQNMPSSPLTPPSLKQKRQSLVR